MSGRAINLSVRRHCPARALRGLGVVAVCLLCLAGLWAQSPPPEDFSQRIPAAPGIGLLAAAASPVDLAIQQKRYGQAEQLLYAQIQQNPKSSGLLERIAGVFFLDHRYLNCAIALKKAESLAPLDGRHRFLLAMAYVLMGHEDWARPELQTLQAQDPKQALYPYWLARIDFAQRRYPQTLQKLHQALELDSGYANAWDLQGLCNYSLGRSDEAVRSYRQAVAANRRGPHSPWPPLDFASLLIKLGRLAEARPLLQEALQLDPKLVPAHEQLGLLLEKQHKPEAAIGEWSEAARLAPKDPEPHYALARIYRNRGDSATAKSESEMFLKLKQSQDRAGSPVLKLSKTAH